MTPGWVHELSRSSMRHILDTEERKAQKRWLHEMEAEIGVMEPQAKEH